MIVDEEAEMNAAQNERETFEGFGILELMGHRRLAGWLSEQEIAGQGMIRIDIPNFGEDQEQKPWSSTHFYSPQALYSVIPCGKDEALAVAETHMPQPITEWDVRSLLPEIRQEVKAEIESDVRREAWDRVRKDQPQIETHAIESEDDDFESMPVF